MYDKAERAYAILMAGFVVVLVLTNIIGVKLFVAFPESLPQGLFGNPITLTCSLLAYPITFLLTDIVCEIYGQRRANLMVITGFVMSLLVLVMIEISLRLPGSPVWASGNPNYATVGEMQMAFESVFTLPGVLILGSMSAYLVAQLTDVKLFHWWKKVTNGRHLWIRNNGSTMLSQLIDTIIVNAIFLGLGLGLGWQIIAEVIVANYIFKLGLAAIDTPFIYLGVWWLRRYLGDAGLPETGTAS